MASGQGCTEVAETSVRGDPNSPDYYRDDYPVAGMGNAQSQPQSSTTEQAVEHWPTD
jgi:hypothetical protein